MSNSIPHSAVIAEQLTDYLRDLEAELSRSVGSMSKSSTFRGIFQNSLRANAVLVALGRRELALVKHAADTARRLPLLVACRQVSLAYVELRRFLELVIAFPYFREHPIEWCRYLDEPTTGTVGATENPISFAAHRDRSWYVSYVRDRFRGETTGLVVEAADELASHYSELSAHVHVKANVASRSIGKPFDDVANSSLRAFQETQRAVLSAGCVVVAGAKRRGITKLGAIDRAWFDWLIGKKDAKRLRSGAFGLD